MFNNTPYVARDISEGMGMAVAQRTILRRKADGDLEVWGDVARRVAVGNCSLHPSGAADLEKLEYHIGRGNTLMSGRHLQHGDENQSKRNMEVFTNCSTAAASFLSFYLLLNGSGVGRCYDDDMMLVDWDRAPTVRCVLDSSHPDFDWANHESKRDALHKFGTGPNVVWHTVEDSREGWSKALEIWEVMAFEKIHSDRMLVLDFSPVRCKGSPIGGMQNRPASGPVPLMGAFLKAATLKGAGLPRWLQAMYVDHYFAECVLVGGARRAARMATKHWSDPNALDFVIVKRPIEYNGLDVDEIVELRTKGNPGAFLWSSNNSVTVDAEFWKLVKSEPTGFPHQQHAINVFNTVCEAAYANGTGEPGFINSDMLVQNDAGWSDLNRGDFVGSAKFQVEDDSQILLSKLAKRAKKKKHHTIVNPCGEIPLNVLGGFCVIADIVPFHCDDLDEIDDCLRTVTRALIRVNLMDSIYNKEVNRTNRIGVGFTGIHEFAWKFFGLGFLDLIDEEKGQLFWNTMRMFNLIVRDEAERYCKEIGVNVPHTMTTVKPAGTTSKLFGLTEGWHLPSMRQFLRFVQFRNDDPLVETYRNLGYPVRELVSYQGTSIVGFPTKPAITTLGMGDKLVTAPEATPEQQFEWLRLGEKYWIEGTDGPRYGGQISFTLKYDPKVVSYATFRNMIFTHQDSVRCCSVMPQEDSSAYEYQPEQPVSQAEYEAVVRNIQKVVAEDVSFEHIDCASGACPVDFGVKA